MRTAITSATVARPDRSEILTGTRDKTDFFVIRGGWFGHVMENMCKPVKYEKYSNNDFYYVPVYRPILPMFTKNISIGSLWYEEASTALVSYSSRTPADSCSVRWR
jgi:hypothetical protein